MVNDKNFAKQQIFLRICHYFLKEGGYLCLQPLVMIELVTNRLGRVGGNVVLIDVIKYPLFFFKASLTFLFMEGIPVLCLCFQLTSELKGCLYRK